MLKGPVHTRDYLVPRGDVERLNELPAQWFARILAGKIDGGEDLEVGGFSESDCASAPIRSGDESTGELVGVVHFLGLYAEDQSYHRFSVVDHTPGSQIIAAARHMVTLGDVIHCEVNLSMPVAAW